jgi:hypothetical protein
MDRLQTIIEDRDQTGFGGDSFQGLSHLLESNQTVRIALPGDLEYPPGPLGVLDQMNLAKIPG